MPLPVPAPGLVVHYEFLWSHEHAAGQDEGEKRRPAMIVSATKTDDGKLRVIIAPITHSVPQGTGISVELPTKVKSHLGLDSERSWVILNELNEFIWPGFDLHPVPNTPPGTYGYGFVPPVLHTRIKTGILALDKAVKAISRD